MTPFDQGNQGAKPLEGFVRDRTFPGKLQAHVPAQDRNYIQIAITESNDLPHH